MEAEQFLIKKTKEIIETGRVGLTQTIRHFRYASQHLIKENRTRIIHHEKQLNVYSTLFIKQHKDLLEHTNRQVSMLRPENILKRGFSITYVDDKVLMNTRDIEQGQEIKTVLANGELISIVKQ